jgi:hypothetical protein
VQPDAASGQSHGLRVVSAAPNRCTACATTAGDAFIIRERFKS